MNAYIDPDGVENVAVAVIKQARKDFIKGGKTIYRQWHKIPDYVTISLSHISHMQTIRWMLDAWRFVTNDPYDMFQDAGEEKVIDAWKKEAIIEYNRDIYFPGAVRLYLSKGKKEIYDIADNSVYKKLKKYDDGKIMADEFISARNYILNLPEGKKLLDEWNVIAYERSKKFDKEKPKRYKPGEGPGRTPINRQKYNQELVENRRSNIKKAKKMQADGCSIDEIAKELGVKRPCVWNYLRS